VTATSTLRRPPRSCPRGQASPPSRAGECKRAVEALTSPPVAPDNDNTLNILQGLHPPGQPLDTTREPPPRQASSALRWSCTLLPY